MSEQRNIQVHIYGAPGVGKSALAAKIEEMCKGMGLDRHWIGGDAERALVPHDWERQLTNIMPVITINERTTPPALIDSDDVPIATRTNFGEALEAAKRGFRIYRDGWNGKGMFVYYVPAAKYPAQTGAAKAYYGETAAVPYNAYLALKGVDNAVSTWVPSINDCLAEDWSIVK